MNTHVSHDMLQLLADGELTGDAGTEARAHLKECAACARYFQVQRRFNRRMRNLPGPRLPQEFTESVMASLGIPPRVPLIFRLFEHIASVVAVFVVIAMGGTIWALVAIADGNAVENHPLPAHGVVDAVEGWFRDLTAPAVNWLQQVSLQLPGGLSSTIVVTVLLMATLVAVIDWLIQRNGTASGV
jgi:anti-sigma factor RsiW